LRESELVVTTLVVGAMFYGLARLLQAFVVVPKLRAAARPLNTAH
jgi:hypothetical protein